MRRIPLPLLPAWLRWAGVLAVGAFIFHVSIVTLPPSTAIDAARPVEPLPLDKWRHFVAYFAFAGALAYATADVDRSNWQLALFVVGVTALYGLGIEFGQSLVPNRYFGLGDAYANVLGGVLVLPWFLVRQRLEPLPILTTLRFDRS